MAGVNRGVLYIVWGDQCEGPLTRSIQSVRRFHPELPIHVVRGDSTAGLIQKSKMGTLTPFEATLYLDADTVVMGKLDYGFEQAERFGIACAICECPWLRRYGAENDDRTEYNTGVIFFSRLARDVFSTWEQIAPATASRSLWLSVDGSPRGLAYDDQASFARAVQLTSWNPHVLPLNWNFRPDFHKRFFAPVKIWHDYRDPPPQLEGLNEACQMGSRPVSLVDLVIVQ